MKDEKSEDYQNWKEEFFEFDCFPRIFNSRPYSNSQYWTGTSLQWRLMRGNIFKKKRMSFAFEKTPHISLTCKLVPVRYREYKYGLLDYEPEFFTSR